ncbi:unnamed protein product [Gulo gulo]|uniref:Uncharacterized protein n=1 Tax=Gulo gulo TaxID=48420 RepID=A0A9X9LMN4_GULGU|nr:unnamed protein product [Gulo gulo]
MHGQPLLARGWRRKGGLGQPSRLWGPGSVSPWPGFLSSSCSCLTAQVPLSQFVVTQLPSLSASLGTTARLT